MATSLWKHQIGSLSSLRLLKGNDDLHNPCIITRALARKCRKPSRVYMAASSHWAERGRPPESQAQTPGPWASSPCFLLPLIVPAWLPTAPGQGPGSVWRSLSGPAGLRFWAEQSGQFPFCDIPFPGTLPITAWFSQKLGGLRLLCPCPQPQLPGSPLWRPPRSQLTS